MRLVDVMPHISVRMNYEERVRIIETNVYTKDTPGKYAKVYAF
jgi:hypothetical protein